MTGEEESFPDRGGDVPWTAQCAWSHQARVSLVQICPRVRCRALLAWTTSLCFPGGMVVFVQRTTPARTSPDPVPPCIRARVGGPHVLPAADSERRWLAPLAWTIAR